MQNIILLLSIYGFLESTSYGIYEYQTNKNKSGGVAIFILSTLRTIITNCWSNYIIRIQKLLEVIDQLYMFQFYYHNKQLF